jgi:hypothetical protein
MYYHYIIVHGLSSSITVINSNAVVDDGHLHLLW